MSQQTPTAESRATCYEVFPRPATCNRRRGAGPLNSRTYRSNSTWTTRAAQWTWSPKAVFARMGLAVHWAHKTAPKGGSLGSHRIDYIAYDRDLTIESQRIVTGEHSDHRWPEVTFIQ